MSTGSCLTENSPNVGKLDWAEGDRRNELGKYDKENSVHDPIETANELIEVKEVKRMIEERDEMWRQHERAQLNFVQQENSSLLAKLHLEIEKLQNKLAEVVQNNYEISSDASSEIENAKIINELRSELVSIKNELQSFRDLCLTKDAQLEKLEKKLEDTKVFYETRLVALQNDLNSSKVKPASPKPSMAAKPKTVPPKPQPLSESHKQALKPELHKPTPKPSPEKPAGKSEPQKPAEKQEIQKPTEKQETQKPAAKPLPRKPLSAQPGPKKITRSTVPSAEPKPKPTSGPSALRKEKDDEPSAFKPPAKSSAKPKPK